MALYFNDGLESAITGMGDANRDKLAATYHNGALIADSQLKVIYETSWMAQRLIEVPATDALRNWRIWQGDPKQVNCLETTEKRLNVKAKLLRCLIMARVFGGAALFIGTGEKDLSKPLDPERIKRNGIKYLTILPRTSLAAGDLEDDVTQPNYGKPKDYELISGNQLLKIHPSRLVVMVGKAHIDEWSVHDVKKGWGQSIIQASYTALMHSESTEANVAGLIFEANINVFKIPELMSKLGAKEYEDQLLKRFALAARQKGLYGDLVLDAEEDFSRNSASFANLDNIMERFAIMVGATQGIPASKFLGQSPRGLSANGDNELKHYYDEIHTVQSLEIEPQLAILDECIIRSALGDRPNDITYLWSPLEQPSAEEIADTGVKIANTIKTMQETGLYEDDELREAATNYLINNDVLPTLGDKEFCNHEDLGANIDEDYTGE